MRRNFVKIAIAALSALAAGVLASCDNGDHGRLEGTYVCGEPYDIVYTVKGTRVSMREKQTLGTARDGNFADAIAVLERLSFDFSGTNCTISYGGNVSPGIYTLSGERLVIKTSPNTFNLLYRASPQTIFVFDNATFKLLGHEFSNLTEQGINSFEIQMAMRRK